MTPEDLEPIRSLYDAMNRRDLALLVRHRVRGAASGADVERAEAHLWTRRDRRVASLREFPTLQEAREAARGASG